MREARLVFLVIVPMSSESWYVQVAKPLPIDIYTQSMDLPGNTEKQNAALWRNAGQKELLERNE